MKLNTIPKPCEHVGGGFAGTGWNVNELRIAFCAADRPFGFGTAIALTTRKAALVVAGRRFDPQILLYSIMSFDCAIAAGCRLWLPNLR